MVAAAAATEILSIAVDATDDLALRCSDATAAVADGAVTAAVPSLLIPQMSTVSLWEHYPRLTTRRMRLLARPPPAFHSSCLIHARLAAPLPPLTASAAAALAAAECVTDLLQMCSESLMLSADVYFQESPKAARSIANLAQLAAAATITVDTHRSHSAATDCRPVG